MPDWIPRRAFRTVRRSGETRMVDLPLVNSTEALLWMAQMNCIDMNAWYSRVDKPDCPDFVLFDLDPPSLDTPDGGFKLAIRVAHLVREELERLELESYVKTSGADGIHVLVPIARRATYEQTYAFAQRVAHCFWDLDGPVVRVGAASHPTPYQEDLEAAMLPRPAEIAAAVKTLAAA